MIDWRVGYPFLHPTAPVPTLPYQILSRSGPLDHHMIAVVNRGQHRYRRIHTQPSILSPPYPPVELRWIRQRRIHILSLSLSLSLDASVCMKSAMEEGEAECRSGDIERRDLERGDSVEKLRQALFSTDSPPLFPLSTVIFYINAGAERTSLPKLAC